MITTEQIKQDIHDITRRKAMAEGRPVDICRREVIAQYREDLQRSVDWHIEFARYTGLELATAKLALFTSIYGPETSI